MDPTRYHDGLEADLDITVSCVIPTHLRGQLLTEALDSVLRQKRQPSEVLVISDCDDPVAQSISESFAGHLPIAFHRGEKSGASSSRNHGASLARGDYIAFLDDDDLWRPDYLDTVVSVASPGYPDVVVAWFDVFTSRATFDGERARNGLTAADVIARNWGTTGSNLFVRRSVHEKIEGFDERLRTKNDTDYFYRLLESGATYEVVPRVLVLQRKHDLGQLTDKSEVRAAGNERYLRKHWSSLRLRDRRDLRLAIHRIRRSTAPSVRARIGHTALALLNYSPRKFLEERRLRRKMSTPRTSDL